MMRRTIIILLLEFACAWTVYGQAGQSATSSTDGYTPAVMKPGTPAGSYILGDFDTVNYANMQVNFRFPLVKIGGRGEASTVMTPDFTNMWRVIATPYAYNCGQYGCQWGWNYTIIRQEWESLPPLYGAGRVMARYAGFGCEPVINGLSQYHTTLSRLTFIGPDGTETELVDQRTGGAPEPGSLTNGYNRGRTFVSRDGSSAIFTSSSDIIDIAGSCAASAQGVTGTLIMRNGMRYSIQGGYVTSMQDRNGNLITYSQSGSTRTITDPLGRSYQATTSLFDSGTGRYYDQLTYPGSYGNQRTIFIYYDHLQNLLRSDQTMQNMNQLWPGILAPGGSYSVNNPTLISEIDLPDGTSYQFQYDSYGDVARIVLPTGGAVEYDYSSTVGSSANAPYTWILARHLFRRREYLHSTDVSPVRLTEVLNTITEHAAYEYDAENHLVAKVVHSIVPIPQGPLINPTSYDPWEAGKEVQTTYYASDGQTMLRRIDRTYQQRSCAGDSTCWFTQSPYNQLVNDANAPAHDPQLIAEKTTQGNLVRQTVYGYDVYNNIAEVWEGDWASGVPGAALRHTITTYIATQAAINLNILGLVAEQKTFDLAGNLFSDTKLAYDGSPLEDAPGIVGHNASFGTNYFSRGNKTSSSTWLNTTNSFLTTQYKFNIAGDVVSISDPAGHPPTTLSYNDTCHLYANPLTVTNPLGQTTTLGYDYTSCYNGSAKLTFSIDPNGIKTAYSYDDPLDRLTQIRKAADTATEAQTKVVYNGSTDVHVYQDRASTGHGELHSETLYDGFGREIESRQYEASGTYIATTKSYDALGRLAVVSNPSRTINGTNDGLGYPTTTAYDALGRVLSVTTVDGSKTTTSYSGNQTTVSDPAGKARQYTFDGLDRLVKVVEDLSQFNYVTTYTYDPLDDLTQVKQRDETRAFGYDSLKRLLWSSQPETGAINYHYDANGNVVWRDDNRGVQTCYHYDSLNRIDQKVYFAGSSPDGAAGNCGAIPSNLYWTTPAVYYQYDAGYLGIGHLTRVTNAAATTNYFYDGLGRVGGSQQIMDGQVYNFSYSYDLAGGLTMETYPSGRAVNTTYDGAERPYTASGSLANQTTNYIVYTSYAPHGAVNLVGYGNNVWHAVNFNSRIQPYQIWDVVNNDPNKIFRFQCLYWGGSTDTTGCTARNDADNNGNLRSTWFGYGTGGSGMSPSFSENFSYDGVNRLTGVTDSGGWSRYFAYDQYSNMWLCGWPGIAPNGAAPAANYCSQTPSGIFNNANQIIGRSYDSAGNLSSLAGSNFTYDAENRITTVSQPGIGSVTYAYDGNDRRVRKTNSSGAQTVYVYDANSRLAAEYATAGGPSSPCKTCFVSTDHLGSTRLVTDQNGNTVSRHDYIPFGEEIAANSGGRDGTFGTQDFVNQKFTGKERDQETGLDYFGARYYGNALGRFTSPDPLRWLGWQRGNSNDQKKFASWISNPQNFNLYAYVGGNPLSRTDPTGMYTCQGSRGDCAKIQAALENIWKAEQSPALNSSQKQALAKVAGFYGNPNTKNGVKVVIGSAGGNDANTGSRGKVTTITLDLKQMTQVFSNRDDGSTVEAETAGTVAHEGQHGIDTRAHGMPQNRGAEKGLEINAFETQGYVNQGLGVNSAYGIWTNQNGWNQNAVDTNAERATQAWCQAGGNCQ